MKFVKIKKLAKFYTNLHLQELEHIDSFVKMAKVYFDHEQVDYRTEEILEKEAEVSPQLFLGEVLFIEHNKRIIVVM